MAVLLAQLTLLVLCLTGLCVALLEMPVPRIPLGIAVLVLTIAQVIALGKIHEDEQVYVYPPVEHGWLDGEAEVVATLAVPLLTTMLLTVLAMYLLEARRAVIVRLSRPSAASSRPAWVPPRGPAPAGRAARSATAQPGRGRPGGSPARPDRRDR